MGNNLDSVNQSTNLHKRNEVQFLCFRLVENGDIYAINVFKVKEIIKYTNTVTRTTHDDNALLEGIITVRDKIYPIVDLKKWFAYDSEIPNVEIKNSAIKGDNFQILICDFSQTTLAIKISKAERILTKKWADIHQVSSYSPNKDTAQKIINHTKYFDGELVKVVNVEKMLIDVFPNIEDTQIDEIDNLQKIVSVKDILLAEDSPVAMKMMKKILDKLGVRFKAFENGQLLLDYINNKTTNVDNIGLIITDLEMPIASGFEVIKQIKNNKEFSHIPITVNSSMSGKSNKDMAISLNADDFISKSHPKEVERVISKFIKEN